MELKKTELISAVDDSQSLEIIELDDRLDLATDPLFFADNGCCGNKGCICPQNP
jgi:hypothetical protein